MSGKEYTTELLKLEDAQLERPEETAEKMILQISLKRKMHNCPRGKDETNQVHDDRFKTVRNLSIRGKPLKLRYRRRRYFCPICGDCSFFDRYQHFTRRENRVRCPGFFPSINSKATQTVKNFNVS